MTTLMRWNPLFTNRGNVPSLHDEIDRLFGSLAPSARGSFSAGFTPAADILETGEEFVVRLDVPGVSPKDVKVTLVADTLTIRGERKFEDSQEKASLHYRERAAGSFERTFKVAGPVRSDQVHAQYRDGVLEVRVPKADEARPREIEVRIS